MKYILLQSVFNKIIEHFSFLLSFYQTLPPLSLSLPPPTLPPLSPPPLSLSLSQKRRVDEILNGEFFFS